MDASTAAYILCDLSDQEIINAVQRDGGVSGLAVELTGKEQSEGRYANVYEVLDLLNVRAYRLGLPGF